MERQILDGPKVITVPPDQTSYLIENLNIDLNYTFIVSSRLLALKLSHLCQLLKVRARTAAGYGANSTAVTADLSLGRVVGKENLSCLLIKLAGY